MPGKRRKKIPESIRPYQWVKGRSGNPAGRPPGIKSLAKMYKDQLNEPASRVPAIAARAIDLGLDPDKTSMGAVLSLAQIYEAILGRHNAAKDVADRVDNYLNRGLSRHQIVSLAEAITDIINQEVHDPQVKAVIAERIAGLAGTINYDDAD